MNAEFKRIARRDKKAFLNEQSKEIEENNRMGKTRDLVKKTGAVKGTFHARMGMTKNRNGKDLTEEEIKKRWQEYTELYKKKECKNAKWLSEETRENKRSERQRRKGKIYPSECRGEIRKPS